MIRAVPVERSLDLDGTSYGSRSLGERYEVPVARTVDGFAEMLFDALNNRAFVPGKKLGPRFVSHCPGQTGGTDDVGHHDSSSLGPRGSGSARQPIYPLHVWMSAELLEGRSRGVEVKLGTNFFTELLAK